MPKAIIFNRIKKNHMDFKKFKKSNLFRKIMSEFDPGSE